MTSLFRKILTEFVFQEYGKRSRTIVEKLTIAGQTIPKFINEFWTAKQRQANSLHEVSYRACFKPQLPRFFIERLSKEGDIVYDPFSGRGTTVLEAAILNRNVIANDVNPLSAMLSRPRLFIPTLESIAERLDNLPQKKTIKSNIDLTMFFHKKTMEEIVSLRSYLEKKHEDDVDRWIRMVATNRLTGHSNGFFSVYTLPPNQATSQESQKKINKNRKQKPEYRNTRDLILKKSKQLMGDSDEIQKKSLQSIGIRALFITGDSRDTKIIKPNSVQLTVTSPPFLDVVQYSQDNWLRCWFNGIDAEEVGKNITMSKTVEDWNNVMRDVFKELFRVTKKNGWIAFEVGEVRNGKIKLEEFVVKLGVDAGFTCEAIMINQQQFTKTANIWGVANNTNGTNSNRIVIFQK